MGAVYEAEQQATQRIVALKIIRAGFVTAELLRRFELETHALGRLQHAGIAQIYQAGTADTGVGPQPYFAMELIRGHSLLRHAEAQQLTTRLRLELMAKICEAVHHAHQRGIIHRDLKPANILVDDTGQPKILDFGVARVTNSDAQATRHTDLGQLVGTLAYMSPEQVLADPLELDTRSDVYALGVILYQLLAGRLPYKLSGKLHEAVQAIREEDPAPLSSISRKYRGDIETIVAKALEKEKERRYPSAAGMAADLRRHLANEPITARPATASYQLRKFAHRHKTLVASAATVFVVLFAGVVASTWEAVRARQAEQKAVAAEQTSKAVGDFLRNDLLAQASASTQAGVGTKPDPDLKVRTALERAAGKIAGRFTKQPLLEASIRATIGASYRDLGLYNEAEKQFERAVDLNRSRLGEQHRDTLNAINDLADIYTSEGKYAQAEPLFVKTLEVRRRISGEENAETLGIAGNLANLYKRQGKYAEAEALTKRVAEIGRRVWGEEHPDTVTAMNNLGRLYTAEGKYEQAEATLTKVLELCRRVMGDEHPVVVVVLNNLARAYSDSGKYAQAEPLYLDAVERARRALGEAHPNTLQALNNLGLVYLFEGKNDRAEEIFSKTLEMRHPVPGEAHPDTLSFMSNLAHVYASEKKYKQAEELYSKALDGHRRVLGKEHSATLIVEYNFAVLQQAEGRYGEAEASLTAVYGAQKRVLGLENRVTLLMASSFGLVQVQQRKYREAENTLREALPVHEKTGPDKWQRYNCQSLLGASLAGQKRYAEAEPLLVSGYVGIRERKASISAVNKYFFDEAKKAVVRLYVDWNKPEKAAEWRARIAADQQ